MLALVFDAEPRLTEVEDPVPGKEEALVRTLMAGICGTDLELLGGYKGFRGIAGHEMVGVVEHAPEPGWQGARVVPEINIACGTCPLCREGLTNHCERRRALGISGWRGAFAELTAIPLANLHRVPDGVRDEEAVWTEPLAAALAVMGEGMKRGDRVLVVGDGRLGALVALGLASRGVRAELVGKHPAKMSLLETLGVSVVRDAPRPIYPWVVEATGSASGVEAARVWVRPRGTLIVKSTCHERISTSRGSSSTSFVSSDRAVEISAPPWRLCSRAASR
jgi:threonine dehydrogenase-like Zn-dependent dehydrogenase